MNKKLIAAFVLTASILGVTKVNAAQTSSQYTQRYIIQDMYGAAFTANGQTEDLISSPATPYPLNKTMWIFFPQQINRPGEWVELGGGKGLTATSIKILNPKPEEQTYWNGHYFTYQRVTADGSRWYYEGTIGSANPTGSHRYKLERDLTQPNRWKSSVDNIAAYFITIAGASNYNVGKQLNIGIESKDNQHSFTNGTSVENIWTYPVGASGFQNYTGSTPIAAENNSYQWYSLWYPIQNGNPNAIQFLHP